jgi:hypothetical protein
MDQVSRQSEVITTVNGQQAREELKMLEQQALKYKQAMIDANEAGDDKAFGKAKKSFQDTNKEIRAVQKSLFDVNTVLDNLSSAKPKELQAALSSLGRQLNSGEIARGSEEWDAIVEAMKRVRTEQSKLSSEMNEGVGNLDQIANKAKGFSSFMIAKGVAIGESFVDFAKGIFDKIGSFVEGGLELAAKTEGIQRAFDKINDPHLLDKLKEATDGTVDSINLMQQAVKADHFKIPLDNLGQMLKFVKDRSDDTGESFEELEGKIIEAFGKNTVKGFVQLGISSTELKNKMLQTGDAGKAAFEIIQESLKKTADYQDTAQDKQERYEASMKNFQLRVGQMLLPLKSAISEVLSNVATSMANVFEKTKSATDQFKDQINVVSDLQVHISPLLDRYDQLSKKTNLNKKEHEELSSIVKQVTEQIPGAASAFDKYGNAISISTQRAREFINAQAESLKYLNSKAITEADKDIEKATSKVDQFKKRMDEISKTGTFKVTEQIVGSGSSLGGAQTYERDATEQEVAEMQKIYQKSIADKMAAESAKKALDGTSLKEQIENNNKKTLAQDDFNKMTEKQLKAYIAKYKEANDKYVDIAQQIYSAKFGQETEKDPKKEADAMHKEFEEIKAARETFDLEMKNIAMKDHLEGELSEEQYNKRLQEIEMNSAKFFLNLAENGNDSRLKIDEVFWNQKASLAKDGTKNAFDAQNKMLTLQLAEQKQLIENLTKNRETKLTFVDITEETAKQTNQDRFEQGKESEPEYKVKALQIQASADAQRVAEEKNTLAAINAANMIFGADKEKLITEQNKRIAKAQTVAGKSLLELEKLQLDTEKSTREKYDLYTSEDKKNAELNAQKQLLAANLISLVTYLEACKAITDKYEKEGLQIKQQYGIASMTEVQASELKALEDTASKELWTTEQTEQAKFKLKMKFAEEYAQQAQKFIQLTAGVSSAYSDMETALIEAKYQKQIQAANGNAAQIAKIEQNEAQAKLDAQKQSADVDFAIKASQIVANTAVAIMQGYAELGPIAGTAAAVMLGATGAMELVSANAEREKVKALTLNNTTGVRVVTGAEDGGSIDVTRAQDGKQFNATYDPDKRGYVDKPTVLVGEGPTGSSKEWVASNAAVNNPTIAPVINMIDIAQRSGNVASFDMNKYFKNHISGHVNGGFISIGNAATAQSSAQASGAASVSSDPELKAMMTATNKLLTHLATNGVDASLVYTEWEKKVNLITKSRSLGTL